MIYKLDILKKRLKLKKHLSEPMWLISKNNGELIALELETYPNSKATLEKQEQTKKLLSKHNCNSLEKKNTSLKKRN